MFDKFFNGLCPECLLENVNQGLWLNRGDLFECPRCHLMVSLASGLRATILRRRGQGHFKSLEDPYYSVKRRGEGNGLCRESKTELYDADGFNLITTEEELKEYLNEIIGVDPHA